MRAFHAFLISLALLAAPSAWAMCPPDACGCCEVHFTSESCSCEMSQRSESANSAAPIAFSQHSVSVVASEVSVGVCVWPTQRDFVIQSSEPHSPPPLTLSCIRLI